MDWDKHCYIPYHGITIESNTGALTFCCQDNSTMPLNYGERVKPAMNISEVDDLQEWWAKEYQDIWNAYDENKQGEFYPCNTCFGPQRTNNNTVFESYRDNLNSGKYKWKWKRGGDNRIRFLELAASNICNQMCVMCSGRHSNQWHEHDHLFGRAHKNYKLWRFNEKEAAKIHKLIPDLDVFYLKGGDPLADQMHMDFLHTASETNPDCTINLQTNMQGLRKRDLPMFKKFTNLIPLVSIDGTHDIYNWIRGGDFNKVTKNMEMLYGETGIRCQIMITISLYNFWSLEKIFEYFYDKPYMRWMQCHNIVSYPTWCSHLFLHPDEVENQLINLMSVEHYYGEKTTFRDFFDPRSYYKESHYKEWLHKVWEYTNEMNKIRGYDILDHVPELRKILQAI